MVRLPRGTKVTKLSAILASLAVLYVPLPAVADEIPSDAQPTVKTLAPLTEGAASDASQEPHLRPQLQFTPETASSIPLNAQPMIVHPGTPKLDPDVIQSNNMPAPAAS